MAAKKQTNMSIDGSETTDTTSDVENNNAEVEQTETLTKEKRQQQLWYIFLENATDQQIKKRFTEEVNAIVDKYKKLASATH